jgi:RNA polymerase sigma-70 factor (family 1)
LRGDYLHNDKDLINLVAKGNELAFSQLFENYQDRVYKTAFFYLKSDTGAEEVVQEVFLKIWQKRQSLNEVSYFTTWLLKLTKHHIIDHLRKMARESAALEKLSQREPIPENGTDFRARHYQYELLLKQAVSGLSPRQKDIYKLVKEDGLTYEEAGERLTLSPLTIKTHMARALQSIREFLQKHGEIYFILLLLKK